MEGRELKYWRQGRESAVHGGAYCWQDNEGKITRAKYRVENIVGRKCRPTFECKSTWIVAAKAGSKPLVTFDSTLPSRDLTAKHHIVLVAYLIGCYFKISSNFQIQTWNHCSKCRRSNCTFARPFLHQSRLPSPSAPPLRLFALATLNMFACRLYLTSSHPCPQHQRPLRPTQLFSSPLFSSPLFDRLSLSQPSCSSAATQSRCTQARPRKHPPWQRLPQATWNGLHDGLVASSPLWVTIAMYAPHHNHNPRRSLARRARRCARRRARWSGWSGGRGHACRSRRAGAAPSACRCWRWRRSKRAPSACRSPNWSARWPPRATQSRASSSRL